MTRRWRLVTAVLTVLVLAAGTLSVVAVTRGNRINDQLRELDTDIRSIQWVITGYSLTLAALTITGGRMGDIFGRKRLFVIGMSLFTVASALCGVA